MMSDKELSKYKFQRWHYWFFTMWFTMMLSIYMVEIFTNQISNDQIFVYGILCPFILTVAMCNCLILLTIYSKRLDPLIKGEFSYKFAEMVYKTVCGRFFYPTSLIFAFMLIILSFIIPIYFGIYFNTWWVWILYAIDILINLFGSLFVGLMLWDLHITSKVIYLKYEVEQK